MRLYGPTYFSPVINHVARWVTEQVTTETSHKINCTPLYNSTLGYCQKTDDEYFTAASCMLLLFIDRLGYNLFKLYLNLFLSKVCIINKGWLRVLHPPHHFRWSYFRHGSDQGSHCKCMHSKMWHYVYISMYILISLHSFSGNLDVQ